MGNNQARKLYAKTYRAYQHLLALRDSVQHDMEFANDQDTYYHLRYCLNYLIPALDVAGRAAIVVPADILEELKKSHGEVVRLAESKTPRDRIETCRRLVLGLLSEVALEAGRLTAHDPDFVGLVAIEKHLGRTPRILDKAHMALLHIA